MRNLSFIFSMLLCFYSQAQITITSTDMPAVGDTFHSLRDPLPLPPGFSIGLAGANRTWDFSNLNGTVPVNTYAVLPSTTPYAADFPSATYAITTDLIGYSFYNNTSPALKFEGYSTNDVNLGAISINFIPPPEQYHFPASYLTNFSGTTRFKESKNYNQLSPAIQHLIDSLLAGVPGVTVNSIDVTDTTVYKDTIDAWGKVITPIGTYDALRNKRIETGTTWVIANLQSLFGTIPYTIAKIPKNTTEHSWLTSITKIPLITLGYDTLRNINSVTYSITPPPPPIASFQWGGQDGTINFFNASQNYPETFVWDFGDNSNSSIENPAHFYSANGSYYVCLTVTNAGGSNTYCDSVVVTGVPSIITGIINGSPFCEEEAVSVPFSVSGSSLEGDIFTAQLSDSTGSFDFPVDVGSIIGNGSINYFLSDTIDAIIPVGTLLGSGYRIRVVLDNLDLTGTDNGVDLTIASCSSNSITISGKVVSEEGDGIRWVTVNSTGTSNQTDFTDTLGNYALSFNTGDSAIITPSKANDTITNNGITTLDIIFIQREILVIQPLPLNTPYKKIAADVNGSKTVTTLDIVFIRSVILAVNPTFPGGKLWAFVPDDYVFPDSMAPFIFPNSRAYDNLTSNLTNQNFIGIKLGDVNSSWDPGTSKAGAVGEVQFVMDEHNVLPGQEIIIPVKVNDFKNITGYQFTMSWNPNVLAFEAVTNKALSTYFGMNKTSDGFLTTSWNDEMAKEVSLDDDAIAFELKFRVIGATGTASEIKIGSEMTESEAYNENLDLLNITPINGVVKVGEGSFPNTQHPTPYTLSVQPNPFSNCTQIIFELPKDETVTLSIYDILGREVKRVKEDYKAGEHSMTWNGEDANGNKLNKGLYHVRLIAGTYSNAQKVVVK